MFLEITVQKPTDKITRRARVTIDDITNKNMRKYERKVASLFPSLHTLLNNKT